MTGAIRVEAMVTPMRLAIVALMLVASGCLGSSHGACDNTPDCGGGGVQPCPQCAAPPAASFHLDAPHLAAGHAWTFKVDGLYNVGGENTVVVAPREGGYLFAGAAEKDVWEAAVWGRAWQGPQDAALNTPDGARRFDWPLAEGKTWAYSKTLNVTATAADIKLPNGSIERGFVIAGKNEKQSVEYDYAPSVGFWTKFTSSSGGIAYQRATLVRERNDVKPIWFDAGPRAGVSESGPPSVMQVPAGFDAVLASAGGTAGHAVLVPPGGAPWTWDATDKETWSYQSCPAAAGPWSLATAAQPQTGFSYVTAVAVKWTHP